MEKKRKLFFSAAEIDDWSCKKGEHFSKVSTTTTTATK